MNPTGDRWARFGVFEADLRERTLTKSGHSVAIQDQPFRVLATLLRRPGDLVTREEVREAVWPGDTTVDFERGLNTAVNKLRAALGDSADSPRFIETVPRRGYRFLAPVEWSRQRWARSARSTLSLCQTSEDVVHGRRWPVFSSWSFLQPATQSTGRGEVTQATECISGIEPRPQFISFAAEGDLLVVVVCSSSLAESQGERFA